MDNSLKPIQKPKGAHGVLKSTAIGAGVGALPGFLIVSIFGVLVLGLETGLIKETNFSMGLCFILYDLFATPGEHFAYWLMKKWNMEFTPFPIYQGFLVGLFLLTLVGAVVGFFVGIITRRNNIVTLNKK
jgi:hypothetical protein